MSQEIKYLAGKVDFVSLHSAFPPDTFGKGIFDQEIPVFEYPKYSPELVPGDSPCSKTEDLEKFIF
jgi:hypothetical protein